MHQHPLASNVKGEDSGSIENRTVIHYNGWQIEERKRFSIAAELVFILQQTS
jgi:Zn-dependent peptidase ImmA (M78 family)